MASLDLISMLGNLSQSFFPIMRLITGFAYIIGLIFFIVALQKLRKIGDHRARSSSQERMFVPVAYTVAGAAFVFLPSAVTVLANSTFGDSSILMYSDFNKFDIIKIMTNFIKLAGMIWFIRGTVLLAHASQPGVQEGPKGLVLLIAGILAMNFEFTISTLNSAMGYIISRSMGS